MQISDQDHVNLEAYSIKGVWDIYTSFKNIGSYNSAPMLMMQFKSILDALIFKSQIFEVSNVTRDSPADITGVIYWDFFGK